MNILVIKQTSLGDVLHASGHVRAIKQRFPQSRLVLLTDKTSRDIYRYNPWVDHIIEIDRYGFKANWYRKPKWAFGEMGRVMAEVRQESFDLAFDLQGLAKSVIFLYGARASRKFVKGRWPGIPGYRNKHDHALDEMDRVLNLAGISTSDTHMELHAGPEEGAHIDQVLGELNPEAFPVLVMSPFSRWPSKDWPLDHYLELCAGLEEASQNKIAIFLTGAQGDRSKLEEALASRTLNSTYSLVGKLPMLGFFELLSRARLLVTGDSFPMHAAVAVNTPVVALFGPTHESRVGPRGDIHSVIRAPGCRICDRKNCARACLTRIDVDQVLMRVRERLAATETG